MGRTFSRSKVILATSVIGSSLLIFATFGILGPNIPNLTPSLKQLDEKDALLREDYEAHRPRARTRHAREESKQNDEDSMANLVPSLEKDNVVKNERFGEESSDEDTIRYDENRK